MALRSVTRRIGSKFFPMFSSANQLHSHATSFGFKEVPEEEKSRLVGNVFSNVASNYDLMNDLMSGGLHRLWKDRLVSELNPFPGMKHLDVAGGTGDVAFRILDRINDVKRRAMQDVREDDLQDQTQVYVCDINPRMLSVGKKRAIERGLGEEGSLIWVEGDAEALSFPDNSMDGYTIAFGIRNVTHIEKSGPNPLTDGWPKRRNPCHGGQPEQEKVEEIDTLSPRTSTVHLLAFEDSLGDLHEKFDRVMDTLETLTRRMDRLLAPARIEANVNNNRNKNDGNRGGRRARRNFRNLPNQRHDQRRRPMENPLRYADDNSMEEYEARQNGQECDSSSSDEQGNIWNDNGDI
ncbi:2-methoxy-6-polyprenyl-1,4-benzoquinol methylase [Cucumis melo var. makuwa]|uniref:2-methoxy-6-polyprenyl-1,4-benzoquinol methylase n=1 Tax=Cucumis melo var. makuwa TaxID=1194695 RepID=A0A5D3DBZ2_CUCMM|nr:2-methoxy-6-polyprenyl-1,4-benzoquinol methylase [Cucumis melo var. makuwa]